MFLKLLLVVSVSFLQAQCILTLPVQSTADTLSGQTDGTSEIEVNVMPLVGDSGDSGSVVREKRHFAQPIYSTAVVSAVPVIQTIPVVTTYAALPTYGLGYGSGFGPSGFGGGYGHGGFGGGFVGGFGVTKFKAKGFGFGGGFIG